MKSKKTVQITLKIGAIFAACTANAQLQLEFTPQAIIKPQLEQVLVKNDDDFLQCSIDMIEVFECGMGTFVTNSGDCSVAESQTTSGRSESFALDWQVNDVESCWGTGGTAEWRGTLKPYSGGTGSYSKTLYNGITETTDFTLNCQAQGAFAFEGKVMASYFPFMMTEPAHKLVAWDAKGVHILKKEGYRDEKTMMSQKFPDGYAAFIAITDIEPKTTVQGLEYQEMKNTGLCGTLGEEGAATLHISPSIGFEGTCAIQPNKKYYLVHALIEDGQRVSINPYKRQKNSRVSN